MQEPNFNDVEILCFNLVNGDISKKKRLNFNSFDVKITSIPKKNCKKCYGRGWIGSYKDLNNDELDGLKVPCKCIFKKEKAS